MFGQTKPLSLIPDVTSMMLVHECVASVGWVAERGGGGLARPEGGLILQHSYTEPLSRGG